MIECFCKVCGKFFESEKEKDFCSNRCYRTAWQIQSRAEKRGEIAGECFLNEGVECYQRNCNTCGWNPKVQHKRLAIIAKRLEN